MAALPSRGSVKAAPDRIDTQPANALLFPVDEDLLTRIRSLFLSRNANRIPKTPNPSPERSFQGLSLPGKAFWQTRQSTVLRRSPNVPESTVQDKGSADARPRSPGYTAAQATRLVTNVDGVRSSQTSTGYQSPFQVRAEGQPYTRRSSLARSVSRKPSITNSTIGVPREVSRQELGSTNNTPLRVDEATAFSIPGPAPVSNERHPVEEAARPSPPSSVISTCPKVADIPGDYGNAIPEPKEPDQEQTSSLEAKSRDVPQDQETIVASNEVSDQAKSSRAPQPPNLVRSGGSVETVESGHSSLFKPSAAALEAASPILPIFTAEWPSTKPCLPGPPLLRSLKPQKERASSAQLEVARGRPDRVQPDDQLTRFEAQQLEQSKALDDVRESRNEALIESKLAEQKLPWPLPSAGSEGTDSTRPTTDLLSS